MIGKEEYMRVGTTLYKVVNQPCANGGYEKKRVVWSNGTLRLDYGKNYIATVPKYDGFCTIPNHLNYQKEIDGFLNLYVFPYVEKLMPTIKFLRDTLNFGDAVIRKLCTFKDVSIKGELYSREFNQRFKADGAVCSLKQDTEGKFDFKIDGVSYVSWFRRKKDEFMETLGIPTKRQKQRINL